MSNYINLLFRNFFFLNQSADLEFPEFRGISISTASTRCFLPVFCVVIMEEKHEEPTGTIRRLMITKLVLENFKSYGGIKEIGPFHKVFEDLYKYFYF